MLPANHRTRYASIHIPSLLLLSTPTDKEPEVPVKRRQAHRFIGAERRHRLVQLTHRGKIPLGFTLDRYPNLTLTVLDRSFGGSLEHFFFISCWHIVFNKSALFIIQYRRQPSVTPISLDTVFWLAPLSISL